MSTETTFDIAQPLTQAVGRLSDRALARLVGANAYLRGRVYAKQQCVHELKVDGFAATGRVHGRASDPYEVRIEVSPEGAFSSRCSCPAWRGADRHCKHVAAVLVALREKVRPPRAPDAAASAPAERAEPREARPERHEPQRHERADGTRHEPTRDARTDRGERGRADKHRALRPRHEQGHGTLSHGPREVVVLDRTGPRVVSAAANPAQLQSASVTTASQDRQGLAVWLPPTEPRRPPEFEYRINVRTASLAVTVYQSDTRQALQPEDALTLLGAHVSPHGRVLKWLSRLHRGVRGVAVEARGEDAAELLSRLKGRRVLLDPALMELRYLEETLQPRLELELVPPAQVRLRCVFERKGDSGRKFNLSQGVWLEGEPGWHLDPIQGVVRPLSEQVTPTWLERLQRSPAVTIPMHEIGRFLSEVVPRVALSMGAPLPEISTVVDIVDAAPGFTLRAAGDLLHVKATLCVTYGSVELPVPPVELPPPLAFLPGDSARPRCIRRDVGAEREAIDQLVRTGLEVTDDFQALQATGDAAVRFWTDGVSSLPEDWDRYIPENLVDVTVRPTPVSPRARVSSGVDWLGLDVEWSSEGAAANEEDIREALARGHKMVRLKDGSWAPLQSDKATDVLARLQELYGGGKGSKLPLSQAGRVQDLLAALDTTSSVAPQVKDFFAQLSERQKIDLVPLPKEVTATMRPYQVEGFSWLALLHKLSTGGILADDMGLGKTLQAIALLQWVKELPEGDVAEKKKKTKKKVAAKEESAETPEATEPALKKKKPARKKKDAEEGAEAAEHEESPEEETPDPRGPVVKLPHEGPLALVVAPTSVVPNWVREIGKFAPGLRALAWAGADRDRHKASMDKVDVLVTSYALLRRDEEFLSAVDWGYVILDEAQHIKNPTSATARAARNLKGRRRLALTGTPIENRLSEIWSIFEFVSPGLLGPLAHFEERYARPIDRGDEESARRLRTTIQPLVLRRTKSQVAKDLPEKIVSELLCDLSTEQLGVYRTVLKSVRESVMGEVDKQGLARSQLQILAGLTRLRQAACDPRLLDVPGNFTDEDSGKLVALRELIAEAIQSGHRTLVFSQFVSMLTLVRRALEADGVKYEYLDGSTKDRQERVERFNTDEAIPVFLISLKAGGTGLNLTGADTVVHFDPWWNPAVEDQATDRAHRIGQSKVVTAYRLVARGTIEEKILALSARKRELVASVLGSEDGGLKGLTRDDVESLFAED